MGIVEISSSRTQSLINQPLAPNSISKSFSKKNSSLASNANKYFTKKEQLLHLDNTNLFNSNFSNKPMDSLQMTNRVNDVLFDVHNRVDNPIHRKMDLQFSESFTDHCDHYKSVTSKIISKKANRTNNDFSDANLVIETGICFT